MKASAKPPVPRATYRGEEKWFDLLDEVGPFALRRAFIDAGLSPSVAGGVVFFLDEQRTLDRHFSPDQRTNYRRLLAEFDPDEIANAPIIFIRPARAA